MPLACVSSVVTLYVIDYLLDSDFFFVVMGFLCFCCFLVFFVYIFFFFFFSSRRRHTRSLCDWSSDVCSSDLFMFYALAKELIPTHGFKFQHILQDIQTLNERATRGELDISAVSIHAYAYRSEERRVGKECRSRWARCQ